jgi:hypothetical protein
MRSWQPASVLFHCPLINQEVTVAMSTSYGQGPPIDQSRRMDGCSGNLICGIFPHPHAFHSQGPWGCPYHTNLNKGR